MGSVSVSSCICCMLVSCVPPVTVINAAFCMTCSLSGAASFLSRDVHLASICSSYNTHIQKNESIL